MNIADLIAALQGGRDPNQAIVNQFQPGPPEAGPIIPPAYGGGNPMLPPIPYLGGASNMPGASAYASGGPAMPPPAGLTDDVAPTQPSVAPPSGPPPAAPSTTPQGAVTPVTNPSPAPVSPSALQSPPDLTNMYIELMKKNQNAAALDSGLTLMAAGLSNSQATRTALINAATGGSGGRGAGGITSADLINLQKQDTDMKNALLRKSMLGGLMKEYNLTPETAQYLEASGKLDEVIKHKNTQNLLKVDNADGSSAFHNQITGAKVVDLSPPKQEAQVVQGPQGPELRRTDPQGGFAPIGAPAGKAPDTEVVATPEGKMLIDKNDKSLIGKIIGGAPTPETDKIERADGSTFLRDKRTGAITEVSPPRKPGDAITVDAENLAIANKQREARGDPPLSMEEWIKLKQAPGTSIYVSKDGTTFRQPEPGYEYERNADGTVKIGPDGRPTQYQIKGGGPDVEAAEKAAKKTEKEQEVAKAEAKDRIQQTFKANNVGQAIDGAIEESYKTGSTGALSYITRSLPIGGQSWTTMDSDLETATANVAFDALKQMRDASKTGASGLGQVTDVEQRMLKSVIANLNPHQDPERLREKLLRVKVAMHLLAEDNFGGDQARFAEALNKGVAEALAAEKTKKLGADPNSFGIVPRGQL